MDQYTRQGPGSRVPFFIIHISLESRDGGASRVFRIGFTSLVYFPQSSIPKIAKFYTLMMHTRYVKSRVVNEMI